MSLLLNEHISSTKLGFAISVRGCWLYSNRGIDNEERGAFLRADLEECTTIVTYRSNKSTDTIKLQSLYEREEHARRAGFWGYLMQIVHQVRLLWTSFLYPLFPTSSSSWKLYFRVYMMFAH